MPQHHSSGVFFHYVAALYGVGARAGAYQSVAIIHQPAGGVAGPADRPASGAHPVPGPGRHRAPAPLPLRTALERTGGHLLSPAQAPAGTKRLSNLLRSPKRTHTLLEKFLWRRAGQYLTRLEQLGGRPWPSGKRACWRCRKASHWRGCVRSAPARRHASNTASRATTILPVESPGGPPVIPPRSNRKEPEARDAHIYRERHLVECFVNKIPHYHRVFSKFEKLDTRYLGFLHFIPALIWLR